MNPCRCCHLRTKKLYAGASPEEAFSDKEPEQASPTHFWCNHTQTVIGPDDRPAHKESCTAARSCFEE
jgi:hypothetical protein